MTVPAIRFEELSLSFDGSPLFDRFSCTIPSGRCTCLLGPSGCGKSTLLGLVAGRESLNYSGSIVFEGVPEQEESVSWMAQDDLLLPWFTVEENVLLGAKLRGSLSGGDEERARVMLKEAGLDDVASSYPSSLSGGMRQRVALLRTLIEGRAVILMDEPFSALDALTRMKLQDFSAGLIGGKTVLMVTHDPMEALRMGDRIVVLHGRPVEVKTVIEPGGVVPRNVNQPEIAELYKRLIDTVMEAGEG